MWPILAAIPAVVILLVGLMRGTLPPALSAAAVMLPVTAYGLGCLYMLEESKNVTFCGSCHLMQPIVNSLDSGDGSLAALHYTRGRVPHGEACYTCHSGYGIWGTFDAKMSGVMHLVRTATGRYALPLQTRGPFDIDSCLGCHAYAKNFQAVEAHQDLTLQEQLVSRQLGCTGICHPAAHPPSAVTGEMPPS